MAPPHSEHSIDVVVERQWHIGMHARALLSEGWLNTIHGGFPASRYRRLGIPAAHLRTHPLPALANLAADRLRLPPSWRCDLPAALARAVAARPDLARFVVVYATAYRHLFPVLQNRGHVLVLERGSTHPEHYFHQIETAKREAGLPWTETLPREVEAEIEAGKLAHFIGAGSRMIAESYAQRGHDPERILLAPWCTDPAFFTFRDRGEDRREELRLACVGMVGLRKGLWRLIQIARWAGKRKLKLRVQVVGPLEPEAPGLLVAAPPNVEWLGVRKGAALREILHQADLYCLPSYEEGFGISILEAMSTGLPALVSAETGGKEALRPGQNGLVLSGFTEDALDAELAPLLADKESRLEMGRCARKTVENAYAEQHYREQLIAEYRRMFQRAAEAGESLRSAWKAAPIS